MYRTIPAVFPKPGNASVRLRVPQGDTAEALPFLNQSIQQSVVSSAAHRQMQSIESHHRKDAHIILWTGIGRRISRMFRIEGDDDRFVLLPIIDRMEEHDVFNATSTCQNDILDSS